MQKISVDFSKQTGPIKPMHGICNGPVTGHFVYDATAHFKEAGFPFARLHDSEYPYGAGEFVDISCIFKNFDLPADDPASYNFTFTDAYLKAIENAGSKIIYRLGQTIEHAPIKLHIHPPKDFQKWAEICEHIIRHYNEGWADGYHMNIQYWEIWNEPDLISKCWTTKFEDYYRLYKVTATHLKRCFPDLKIGGPAVTSPMNKEFLDGFFKYITDGERIPMDFCSWHGYTQDPSVNSGLARELDKYLKAYGYTETESVYDEWNYVETWDDIATSYEVIPSLKGAAYCAGVLTELQNSPCDIATYYDGQVTSSDTYCGIFAKGRPGIHGKPIEVLKRKPFYPFKAFNMLYQLGTQVSVSGQGNHIYALAAGSGKNGAVMLSNFTDEKAEIELVLSGLKASICELLLLDDVHDLESVNTYKNPPELLTLEPYNVCLLNIKA